MSYKRYNEILSCNFYRIIIIAFSKDDVVNEKSSEESEEPRTIFIRLKIHISSEETLIDRDLVMMWQLNIKTVIENVTERNACEHWLNEWVALESHLYEVFTNV